MRPFVLVLGAALMAWTGAASSADRAAGAQLIYLSSQQGKAIDVYAIAAETGELTRRQHLDLGKQVGPLAVSPDGRFLYAGLSQPRDGQMPLAEIATLRREADGALSLLKTVEIPAVTPYLRTDPAGRFLLTAHYGAGEVNVFRIEDGICTGELVDKDVTAKNAHCVEFDRSGRFAFVPHTGPNRVYQFRFDAESGKLTPNDPPFVDGPAADRNYHEPRHILFHPRLDVAYTSNERGGGITAWRFDADKGTLTETQTLSSLPEGSDGRSAAADLRLSPDARFAYVSNRDLSAGRDAREGNDTLAGFRLDAETGRMEPIGHFSTEHFPRSVAVDATGSFVYAAGQKSHRLAAYRLDGETGRLERFATYDVGQGPTWVMCLPVE